MTRSKAVDIKIPSPQAVAQMAPEVDEVERERLMARATRLLAERDAVLVAHYYTAPDLQILADRTGGHVADSLEMARFGAEPGAAVTAPRMHWDGTDLQVEPGLGRPTLAALRERWSVNLWPEPNLYFGGVHAVSPPLASAAGDPRRGGAGRRVA